MAVFGGIIKSDNFASGSAGWQIHRNGTAEFNSLQVRQDMIVDGAISAKAFRNMSESEYVSELVSAPKVVWPVFQYNPSPYYAVGGKSQNPCVFTIFATLDNDTAGAWNTIGIVTRALLASQTNVSMVKRIIDVSTTNGIGYFLHTSGTIPYDDYRVITYVNASGRAIWIQAGSDFMIEQISK
jgi:hypothetical protein